VVDVNKEYYRLGGAGNVINNLISLGTKVFVSSVIDKTEFGNLTLIELENLKISTKGIFREGKKISSKKTRILSSFGQQLLRIDRETREHISKKSENNILKYVDSIIDDIDAIIISDYMKGVLTPTMLSNIIKLANNKDKPTIVDPKGKNFRKYSKATIITPNKKEAFLASGSNADDELVIIGDKLLHEIDSKAVLITLGKEGMMLFEKNKKPVNIPTQARSVYDVTGAGDTVVASLGLGISSGLSFSESAKIANIAAGIVVGKIGVSTTTIQEIMDFETSYKLKSDIVHFITDERNKGKKIVFTNGCFDILHHGHVQYLQEAKNLGNILIVGLNSDDSIRRIKGNGRPVIDEKGRAIMLSALSCIDYICIFDEDTPLNLIKKVKPDILVKGAEYKKSEIVGQKFVESYGGRVELINMVEGVSSSQIINKIKEAVK
jgi:D-beta-D-heptose 7-phosphate kinase/D-beta-D-heptose 1-phosphate adenosyltransferase